MQATECALNRAPNAQGSCLDSAHIQTIAQHAKGNSIAEIRKETQCTSDECILTKIELPVEVRDRITREALKTKAGSLHGNYWINNTEIDTCLSQMRKQYPGFAHTFIHMSDMKTFPPSNLHSYNYQVHPLTDINLPECLKGALTKQPPCPQLSTVDNSPLKSIGIVFNTDRSTGSGQHWFAVYISIDAKDPLSPNKAMITIEVFNSSGLDIDSKPFQKYWAEQCIEIARFTGHTCKYKLVSTVAHQRDDTGNCGSYSLFYIYSRLKGAHPEEFNRPNKKITDETMQKFRSVLFTKAN